MKRQLFGPGGILLHLNDDPYTPAMVYDGLRRRYSSTYNCAVIEGTIDDVIKLTYEQVRWLTSCVDLVEQAENEAKRD